METENLNPVQPTTTLKPNGAPLMPSEPAHEPKSSEPKRRKGIVFLALGIAVVALIAIATLRSMSHLQVESAATPIVGVVKAARAHLYNEVPMPAEFRPYVEVELHAKVSGYVDQMNVDFGDKVKSGQLLATLEVPELRDQLHNAVAVQQKAEADYTNADLIYNRLQTVSEKHPELVAQQDVDTAQAKRSSAFAAIAAAKAEVERYQTLVKYTQITAPFDGVITHRYVDPGALIQAGTTSETQSLPLLRVSDNYHLRLDFPVSVQYVKEIHVGDEVQARVESLGGKSFSGKVTRFTDRVNLDTRTMVVEIEVNNPDLEIIPGMYAAVQFKFQQEEMLAVPVQAVTGEKDKTVYVVNEKSEIEPRHVVTGLETPDKCGIVSGLKEGDLVMIGNRSLVQPGQKVETKLVTEPAIP